MIDDSYELLANMRYDDMQELMLRFVSESPAAADDLNRALRVAFIHQANQLLTRK